MRILRVVGELYPTVVGGIAIHAHEMSEMQGKRGHQVTVYTPSRGEGEIEECSLHYKVVRFHPLLKIMDNPISPSLFFDLYKIKDQFDIIHAHSHLFFSSNICAVLRKFPSPPLIITNHGIESQTAPAWVNTLYLPSIGKWTLNSADRIICYTSGEKASLEHLGVEAEKIEVIHNGINTDKFTPVGNKEEIKSILWVGRFQPGKGIEYLIKAFSLLNEKYPDIKLLMVGEGPLKQKIIQQIVQLNLERSIIVKDFIPNSSMPEIYQTSDAFVLPSLYEGVPRTILEAMASGLPVVCSNLSHLTRIVEGSGLLIPPRDANAIFEALSTLITDTSLAKKFGNSGRLKVVEQFSWDDTVTKTIKLYEAFL
jgi:glycosyltransferase involved in cell wall biosynthesis